MSAPEIIVQGKAIEPIIVGKEVGYRQCVHSEDSHGPYVAWRLGNRNPSRFYGWYVLLSPEDLSLMENYNWCGNRNPNGIEVRRRETVYGKQYSFLLGRAIWERMNPGLDYGRYVHRLGHPLDFRRTRLSPNPRSTFDHDKLLRGIVAHLGGWQVQISRGDGISQYIGRTSTKAEGYRMYNRHLRDLKEKHPQDRRIQNMPYNQIDPPF